MPLARSIFAALVLLQAIASTANAQLQLSIASNSIGTFILGGREFKVFPGTQNYLPENARRPPMWHFYVEPLVEPKLDPDGAIQYERRLLHQKAPVAVVGGYQVRFTTRIIVPIVLRNDLLVDHALAVINHQYSTDSGYTFTANQVSSLPLVGIAVKLPDLQNSGCSLQNPTIPVGSGADEANIYLECVDDLFLRSNKVPDSPKLPKVEWLIGNLPSFNATKELTFEAKSVEVAFAEAQMSEIENAKLFADTSGEGGEVFVSRFDLRNLSDDLVKNTQLMVRGRKLTEDEARVCMLDKLMSFPEQSIEAQRFDAEMFKRTYNAKDIEPNLINKTLDERLDKTSDEENVKLHADGKGSAFFGLIEAGGSMNGERFKKVMGEHGVKVEFEGGKWVAKGLRLVHLNVSDFSQKISRSCMFATFGESQPWAKSLQQLNFRKASAQRGST